MMALLMMIMRKMVKNKWLELSLLSGLILSVALISSIPIYTEAILQRVLLKDLENLQASSGRYPGTVYAKVFMGSTSYWDSGDYEPEQRPQVLKDTNAFMQEDAAERFGLPVKHLVMEAATELYSFIPTDKTKVESETERLAEIAARSDLYDHITLIDGRLPASEPVDGIYEALVVQQSLKALNMVLGHVFEIENGDAKTKIKVKPVGVMDKLDHSEPYWHNHLDEYRKTFFIDYELFKAQFSSSKALPAASASWLFVLDYSGMDLNSVHQYMQTTERIDTHLMNRFSTYSLDSPAVQTVETYFQREADLRLLVWSLYVPLIILLAFYLYMVSNLMTERQKTEISVLRSRGASRLQVLTGYLIEGMLLGVIAYAAGPPIGMLLAKALGASSGFLAFVDRTALPVKVTDDSYLYGLYAVISSILMMLFPVFQATRLSIVGQKQQMGRRTNRLFWHRYFFDIIAVAIAIYGLFAFNRQREDMLQLGADVSAFSVDPLLFLVPALFILGFGLLALRLYPLIIRFIFRIGREVWPPYLYSTLIQVGRSGTQYQMVMMFLILTIATGLFSASAARTLNDNLEQKIRYKNGADIVLKSHWLSESSLASSGGTQRIQYVEPPYQAFTELPGVKTAAKVFVQNNAYTLVGNERGLTKVMGIHTADFGRTAWMRDGLLGNHFYEYLNLIALDPKAVLISRSIADKGIRPGDVINVGWSGVEPKTFTVYGIIDYWPTFNPNTMSMTEEQSNAGRPSLVVGHLEYMQKAMALEPYEVWIKLDENAARQPFYDAIAEKKLSLAFMTDTREELQRMGNDPFQLALNGVMTLGFLISVIISFFGFLLYWLLSLTGRVLQFGIFRAMGMSFAQMIGMLITEQILISGAAVLIGGLVGSVTSTWFVSLFQISFNPSAQVPPFQVMFDSSDTTRLYFVVMVMIVMGLLILGWRLSRINIHQALKLGED
ncbi:ABC transporter permease [Paenibacillus sp. MY03]|uniref:ABC transporter permease n=1 Tax=Paenibacillus sp. MY03 TaxID=302980 RepID=UPI00211B547E|nr:FtsX-like permease family protein [Paenibacillus sp. MY03]